MNAPRHYFIETRADEVAVRKAAGYDILAERLKDFRLHSKISAKPATEHEESEEAPPDQPGVHVDSRSDDNVTEEFSVIDSVREGSSGGSEIPKEPERLLVTSGAESSEWIAAGGKRDQDAGVPDASDVRVLDTSGSEMPDEEGTWSYPKEQEDLLEAFLAERRKR